MQHVILEEIRNSELQKEFVNRTVKHPLNVKHKIDPKYQQAFLKRIITELETQGLEISDEIYETYCCVLLSENGGEDIFYKHYILDKPFNITISLKESKKLISQGTTGLCIWQAALALADWCVSHSEDFHGKKVLELGSGVGLTGIATVLCCELESYCFSDYHPAVVENLCNNVCHNLNLQTDYFQNNSVSLIDYRGSNESDQERKLLKAKYKNVDVSVINIPWNEITENSFPMVDIVLAADLVYDEDLFPDLCHALKNLLYKRKCLAIVACTVRDENTLKIFLSMLEKYDLKIKDRIIPSSKHFLFSVDIPIYIYKIVHT